ncbi:MAG: hypothetical protein ACKPGH_11540, partial [Dolichospermum sp.]
YSTYRCYEVQDHPTPNPLPASREVAMMYFITKESAVSKVHLGELMKKPRFITCFRWFLSV